MTGTHLESISRDYMLSERFCKMAYTLDSVVLCKVRPKTKSLGVKLMTRHIKNNFIAAIGDGGNDVDMLREARIGIGLIGKEGRQAVNASD